MRILFLDAYFEPEQIAFTHLEKDLLKGLVNDGHEVEIICPTPSRGISDEVARKYKTLKKEDLFEGHVHITRFSTPREGTNPFIRALRYFWCNLRTLQIGKKIKGIDAVFCNSTPPTQGWIAGKVAKKLKVPFVYSLQDIFPDSLITTGLTKANTLLWKIGRRIEDITYKSCSRIIVISQSMKKNLLQKGVPEAKVSVISNWIDLDSIHPIPRKENSLFDEFGISREKHIILYAGNFGAAQGAEIVLDVAELLQGESDIQFVIFGGGVGFLKAVERAECLSNVFIHSLLPQERISEVYSMGDVAIITCKKGVGTSGMPSKTWSIMACNTPIVASFDLDSELAGIIKETNKGCCVQPENRNALAESLLLFVRKDFRNNTTREYVIKHASSVVCVKEYINTFKEERK